MLEPAQEETPSIPAPQPARFPAAGWVVVFLVVSLAIAGLYIAFRAAHPPPSRFDKYAKVPDFTLTAQDGSKTSLADLKGKVWVANFIFTDCAGPCPLMTNHMAALNRALAEVPDARLVSFTVDPKNDTPAVLAEYGGRVGANAARWKFLTGTEDQMRDVVVKGMYQAISKDAGGTLIHSTRFVLIDRDGWMREYVDGTDPHLVDQLTKDVQDLLKEPSAR